MEQKSPDYRPPTTRTKGRLPEVEKMEVEQLQVQICSKSQGIVWNGRKWEGTHLEESNIFERNSSADSLRETRTTITGRIIFERLPLKFDDP